MGSQFVHRFDLIITPPTHLTLQLFCDELRPQLTSENPKASMAEISKLLASAWRDTSEEDKAAYAAMRSVWSGVPAAGHMSTTRQPFETCVHMLFMQLLFHHQQEMMALAATDGAGEAAAQDQPIKPPKSRGRGGGRPAKRESAAMGRY